MLFYLTWKSNMCIATTLNELYKARLFFKPWQYFSSFIYVQLLLYNMFSFVIPVGNGSKGVGFEGWSTLDKFRKKNLFDSFLKHLFNITTVYNKKKQTCFLVIIITKSPFSINRVNVFISSIKLYVNSNIVNDKQN